MAGEVLLPGGVLSLSAGAAERLIAAGSGDAALLYLALLRHAAPGGARRTLDWTVPRFEAAWAELTLAGLAGPAPQPDIPTPLEPDTPPDYLQADITAAIEGDAAFAVLQREVERRVGKLLSITDLKTLYSLYDYLAMPPEVILLATVWCAAAQKESGKPPRVSQIKKTVYQWHRLGIQTAESAEEYLRVQHALDVRERVLLPALGIRGRAPIEAERKYIAAWVGWGFPDDAIQMAYERTLFKKQTLHWPYMNSILKSWHEKNLHTVAEIRAKDGGGFKKGAITPPNDTQREETARREMDELRRILEG